MGSTREITSKFLNSVLQNGVGRYVCQLQRVTLQFCKKHQLSREMRDYIENDLVEYAHQNPQVVMYVTPHKKYQSPKIVAEYLNGNIEKVDLAKKERWEIAEAMKLLRTQSGQKILKTVRPWRTMTPSTQGVWHPFMHKPQELNHESFPSDNPMFKPSPSRPKELQANISRDLREELDRLKAKSIEAALQERMNKLE